MTDFARGYVTIGRCYLGTGSYCPRGTLLAARTIRRRVRGYGTETFVTVVGLDPDDAEVKGTLRLTGSAVWPLSQAVENDAGFEEAWLRQRADALAAAIGWPVRALFEPFENYRPSRPMQQESRHA